MGTNGVFLQQAASNKAPKDTVLKLVRSIMTVM